MPRRAPVLTDTAAARAPRRARVFSFCPVLTIINTVHPVRSVRYGETTFVPFPTPLPPFSFSFLKSVITSEHAESTPDCHVLRVVAFLSLTKA